MVTCRRDAPTPVKDAAMQKASEEQVLLAQTLSSLPQKDLLIIHGAAMGADRWADIWAARANVPVKRFRANWDRYGKSAGPRRNQKMLDEGKPDLVIAFPGGFGTADMVARARTAGVPVTEITLCAAI
jgi:hypothetical protein